MVGSLKPIGIAFAGGILVAAFVMMVPVANLEAITGATGISEIVPAAAAPLGGTARLMIAFATGVLTVALLTLVLLQMRQWGSKPAPFSYREFSPNAAAAPVSAPAAAPASPLPEAPRKAGGIGSAFTGILGAIVRRARGEGIAELSDLPKLRSADRHPDAPARRPIIASADLGVPFDEPVNARAMIATRPEPKAAPVEQAASVPAPASPTIEQVVLPPAERTISPSVADTAPAPVRAAMPRPVPMPSQPEPERHRPLPRLPQDAVEAIAGGVRRPSATDIAQIIAKRETTEERLPELMVRLDQAVARSRTRPTVPAPEAAFPADLPSPPPLSAVPGGAEAPASADDRRMDDALRAALKSLGRMSAVR